MDRRTGGQADRRVQRIIERGTAACGTGGGWDGGYGSAAAGDGKLADSRPASQPFRMDEFCTHGGPGPVFLLVSSPFAARPHRTCRILRAIVYRTEVHPAPTAYIIVCGRMYIVHTMLGTYDARYMPCSRYQVPSSPAETPCGTVRRGNEAEKEKDSTSSQSTGTRAISTRHPHASPGPAKGSAPGR